MFGMAQKLFSKAGNDHALKSLTCKTALHNWPFLEKLIETYGLNPIDLKLSHTLLKNYTLEFESVAAFLCHLSLSSRNGHLLIKIQNDTVLPSVSDLWLKEATLKNDDLKKLNALIIQGANDLLKNLVFEKFLSNNPSGFATTTLCRFENMFYFQRYFNYETTVLTHYNRLINSELTIKGDESVISSKIEALQKNNILLKEQAEAIIKASKQTITFISGGPGTGKTYTAGYLLKILLDSLQAENIIPIQIALAAPTGKAASNLQKSLGAHLQDFQAKTLHQLLGIKGDGNLKSEGGHYLNADIVIIDESSMIDICMMSYLLLKIPTGARLIFLGDAHQLPSVEAGSIYSDLSNLSPAHSITLKTCLRAELQEIVDFGKAINEGQSDRVLEMLKNGKAVTRLEIQDIKQQHIFKTTEHQFPVILDENKHPTEILKLFDNFRILSPLRQGTLGVDSLNHFFLQELIKKPLKKHSVTIPIMLSKTNVKLRLFNGEVGVLVLASRHEKEETLHLKKEDYGLFPCKLHGFRKIPAMLLPQFEYAYVLSVHKSQGSEFNHILCLLPEGSEHFGREVLYTAVTRARKTLQVLGTDAIITNTILKQSIRLSGILRRNLSNGTKNSGTISKFRDT
jgi:exodeoxyribonuclease V alpha subunit